MAGVLALPKLALAQQTIVASTGVVGGASQTVSAWGIAEAHDENDDFVGGSWGPRSVHPGPPPFCSRPLAM